MVDLLNNRFVDLKSSGMTIFLVTVLSYAMAFCYEIGYLSRFDIDSSVISISVPQLFSASLALFAIVIILDFALLVGRAIKRWAETEDSLKRATLMCAIITLVAVVFTVASLTDVVEVRYARIHYPIIGIVYVILILSAFSRAIYLGHKVGNYRKGLDEAYQEADKARMKALSKSSKQMSALQMTMLPYILAPGLAIAALGFLYAGFGYLVADYHDRNVTVISIKDAKVEFVVSRYGDDVVTKKYNRTTHSLEEGYEVKAATNRYYNRQIIACTENFKEQSYPKNSLASQCPD